MMRFTAISFLSLCCLFIPPAGFAADADTSRSDQGRLTLGFPLYVHHPDNRGPGLRWNQGWLHNEGVLADATWPVWKLAPSTRVRFGVAAGLFDNSIFRPSEFVAADGEIETHVTPSWAFNLGTYAGGITGYERAVSPALTPYVGTSYAVNEKIELGLRGFWLPAKTLGGTGISKSDAFVAAVTVGLRF
jgi:hypothetical protein